MKIVTWLVKKTVLFNDVTSTTKTTLAFASLLIRLLCQSCKCSGSSFVAQTLHYINNQIRLIKTRKTRRLSQRQTFHSAGSLHYTYLDLYSCFSLYKGIRIASYLYAKIFTLFFEIFMSVLGFCIQFPSKLFQYQKGTGP